MSFSSSIHLRRGGLLQLALCLGVTLGVIACDDEPKRPTAVITELSGPAPVRAWLELSGAESENPGGEAVDLRYEWRVTLRPNGSSAAFNDEALMEPALFIDLAGEYEVALKVSTSQKTSAEVRAQITAGPCGVQAPVVSEIQQYPSAPGVGGVVELYAQAEDPDLTEACDVKLEEGDPLQVGAQPFEVPRSAYDLSYAWRLLSRPIGSQASLEDVTSVTPRLLADVSGAYHVEVLVTDSSGEVSAPTVHTIEVSACGEGRPEITALAVSPEPPLVNHAVTLTPSVMDADEAEGCAQTQTFSYAWRVATLPAGSAASLNDASLEVPSFTPDLAGLYQLELVVTDQTGRSSAPYAVDIDLSECGVRPPVIDAIAVPEGLRVGDTARLSATVTDGDDADDSCELASSLSYAWSLIALPAGSQTTLNRADASEPSLQIDVAGEYSVRLVVTDAQGYESQPTDLTFSVGECGSYAPVIAPSYRPSEPTVGGVVALSVSVTDQDSECGLSPTSEVMWTLVSAPASSLTTLSDPRSMTPSLVTDVAGAYEVVVEVTDNTGLMTRASLSFEASPCGGRAPVITAVSHEPEVTGVGERVRLMVEASDADHSPECVALRVAGVEELNSPAEVMGGEMGGAVAGEVGGAVAGEMGGAVAGEMGGAVAGEMGGTTGGEAGGVAGGAEGGLSGGSAGGEEPVELPLPLQPSLTYSWRLLSAPPGGALELDDSSLASPSFTPERSGLYRFELMVTDETGLSSEPFVYEVNVTSCGEATPVATVSSSTVAPRPHAPVQLSVTVSDSDEACGDQANYGYSWRLSAVPTGSEASVAQPSLAAPSFTPDLPGVYEVTCEVTDPRGLITSDAVTVTVTECGVRAPVISDVSLSISPASATEPFVGSVLELVPSVTDADTDDEACALDERLSYHWWLTATPAGSRASLNSNSEQSPSLSPDVAGDYALRLVVTDAQGLESEAFDVAFSVADCGASAPVATVSYASQEAGRADPLAPHAGDLISLTLTATDADSACGTPTLSYQWRALETPAGSLAGLNAPRSLTPSFTADLPGRYSFSVTVTDETGLSSDEVTVSIDVDDCGSFSPVIDPALVTQSPASVNAGQRVSLDATPATTDADTEATCGRVERFSYMWRLASAPAGSQSALNLSDSATPSFTPDLDGEYTLEVTAHDLRGHMSEPVSVTVSVGACGLSAPVVSPSASDLTPNTGDVVQLDASTVDQDSVAPCVDPADFTYHWSFDSIPVGSSARLNAPSARTPSFTADVTGDYVLRVTATDTRGLESAPVTITVSAQTCGANTPVINDTQVETAVPRVGLPVSLSVSASDEDNAVGCALGQPLSYHWSIVGAPAGSDASLLNGMTARPSLIPDVVGDVELMVEVTDPTGRSVSSIVTVTVGTCGVRAPTLDSLTFTPVAPLIGEPTVGQVSFTDPDNEPGCNAGQTYTVEWRVSARPAGSLARFADPSLDAPSFTPDVAGDYEVQVRAVDSAGYASDWATQAFAVTECGDATPTINEVVVSNDEPIIGELVSLVSDFIDTDTEAGCDLEETFEFRWRLIIRPEGSSAELSGASLYTASLTPDAPGEYLIGLMVGDGAGHWSDEALYSINAIDCGGATPVVDVAGFSTLPASPVLGQATQLTATVSDVDSDPGGCNLPQQFSYHWMLTSAPAGSATALNDAMLDSPSFTPDVAGDYRFALWVTDQSGLMSEVERFTVTVDDCGLTAPVASITRTSPVGVPVAGDVVQLSGAGSSDADVACGVNETLSYQWTLMSIPPDSRAELSLSTGLTPWFEADVEGAYVVRLVVSDGLQSSDPVDVTVNVAP